MIRLRKKTAKGIDKERSSGVVSVIAARETEKDNSHVEARCPHRRVGSLFFLDRTVHNTHTYIFVLTGLVGFC